MSLLLPGHLVKKGGLPVGFASSVATVLTESGVQLEARIFDPRDPYKRQHAVRIDVDTISAPKDAPPAPPPS